jgi:hypothetical protein
MKRRLVRYTSLLLGLLAALTLVGYLYANLSIFIVTNSTGKSLFNVTVVLPGKMRTPEVWWRGNLAPNKSKVLVGAIEGSFDVSYETADHQFVARCGYYGGHMPTYEKIYLTEEAAIFQLYSRWDLVGIFSEPPTEVSCALTHPSNAE